MWCDMACFRITIWWEYSGCPEKSDSEGWRVSSRQAMSLLTLVGKQRFSGQKARAGEIPHRSHGASKDNKSPKAQKDVSLYFLAPQKDSRMESEKSSWGKRKERRQPFCPTTNLPTWLFTSSALHTLLGEVSPKTNRRFLRLKALLHHFSTFG